MTPDHRDQLLVRYLDHNLTLATVIMVLIAALGLLIGTVAKARALEDVPRAAGQTEASPWKDGRQSALVPTSGDSLKSQKDSAGPERVFANLIECNNYFFPFVDKYSRFGVVFDSGMPLGLGMAQIRSAEVDFSGDLQHACACGSKKTAARSV